MLSATRQSIWEFDAISTGSTFGRLIVLDQVYLELPIGERVLVTPNHHIRVIVGDSYNYVLIYIRGHSNSL